jgi:hypothetical protein
MFVVLVRVIFFVLRERERIAQCSPRDDGTSKRVLH